MKKAIKVGLLSILAVFVLACARVEADSAMPSTDPWSVAREGYAVEKQVLAYLLDVKLDQISDPEITMNHEGTILDFVLLPESGSFDESELKRINNTIKSGALGMRVDLSYDEDTPGALDVSVLDSEPGLSDDDLAFFGLELANALGVDQDQVGGISLVGSPDSVVVQFQLLPESGSFNNNEVNHINDTLHYQYMGYTTDLSYDEDVPEALDGTIVISEYEDYGDVYYRSFAYYGYYNGYPFYLVFGYADNYDYYPFYDIYGYAENNYYDYF